MRRSLWFGHVLVSLVAAASAVAQTGAPPHAERHTSRIGHRWLPDTAVYDLTRIANDVWTPRTSAPGGPGEWWPGTFRTWYAPETEQLVKAEAAVAPMNLPVEGRQGFGALPAKVMRSHDAVEMVLVPAGEFWMGSDENENETPRHRVDLDSFYIDKYEVTNALYGRFMGATGQSAPLHWNDETFNGANQPVVGVSWHDADAYCKWAGQRLPTEAEWEKAARGTDGRTYPWHDAWDESRANSFDSGNWKTVAVGSYPSGVSPYGLHDMAGNALEWVADWYDDDYYRRSPERNPPGPGSGKLKVFRGGSWLDPSPLMRSAIRGANSPNAQSALVGFRCARGAP